MAPNPTPSVRPANRKSSAKRSKGVTETARLFLDVEELNRQSQSAPLKRYVE